MPSYSQHNVKKCPGNFKKDGCGGKGCPAPGHVYCNKCMRSNEAASAAKDTRRAAAHRALDVILKAKDMRTRPSKLLSNPCPYCDEDHDPSNQCRLMPVSPRGQLNTQLKKSVERAKDGAYDAEWRAACERSYAEMADSEGFEQFSNSLVIDAVADRTYDKLRGAAQKAWLTLPDSQRRQFIRNALGLGSGHDAIQHIAVEPVRGGYQTRVIHGENSAQRQGFGTKRQAEKYGERTLAKLTKQSEAPPKFRTWKIQNQPSHKGECPACHQTLELVDGHLVPHTRAYVYGVQKNFKVDPSNKRYRCKGSGAEPVGATPAMDEAKTARCPICRQTIQVTGNAFPKHTNPDTDRVCMGSYSDLKHAWDLRPV